MSTIKKNIFHICVYPKHVCYKNLHYNSKFNIVFNNYHVNNLLVSPLSITSQMFSDLPLSSIPWCFLRRPVNQQTETAGTTLLHACAPSTPYQKPLPLFTTGYLQIWNCSVFEHNSKGIYVFVSENWYIDNCK